jgi:folate-binding protein YgfZ
MEENCRQEDLMAKIAMLPGRGFIQVGGPEAVPFLQGLVSNDVTKVAADRAIYAALLTAQGKFLHDFFITANGDGLLLECEAERRADLFTRLKRFRLRSKVELADVTEQWIAAAAWGDDALTVLGLSAKTGAAKPCNGGVAYTDPRHLGLGARLLVPSGQSDALPAGFEPAEPAAYESLRLSLGIPSGPAELPVERAFLLESGFDELNGIDWQKGCYVGQEVTARTKYRGLLRRRLAPVTIDGAPAADDTRIMADGRDVGELRAHANGQGLALIKLESIASGQPLTCGGAALKAHVPDWWQLPEPKPDTSAAC